MNKQVLVVIALLSFCKTGLSITDSEAARFGLSALLSVGEIVTKSFGGDVTHRITLDGSLSLLRLKHVVPVFLSPVASALYNHCLTEQTAHANTVSEIKKLQTITQQKLDRLILSNTKLIEFLAQKDHTITSTQDALTLVDKSKQLLEEELISKTERIAFLEDALKSLKEKMEDLAIENESIRAELEASIQGLQLKLKQ